MRLNFWRLRYRHNVCTTRCMSDEPWRAGSGRQIFNSAIIIASSAAHASLKYCIHTVLYCTYCTSCVTCTCTLSVYTYPYGIHQTSLSTYPSRRQWVGATVKILIADKSELISSMSQCSCGIVVLWLQNFVEIQWCRLHLIQRGRVACNIMWKLMQGSQQGSSSRSCNVIWQLIHGRHGIASRL